MLKINNLTDRAEIYIYGDIITDTEASWLKREEDGTLGYQYPTKIKEQLDQMKGKPVDVHIASDGGDVAAGIAIANALKSHDAPCVAYIDSWAASIASVIAFACSRVVMPENSFLMIHNPKAGAFGDAEYLVTVADWLDKLRDMIADTYAKVSGKPVDDVKSLMDAETWFTAGEALDFFGDVIDIVDATQVEAVASLKSKYKATDMAEDIATDMAEETTEETTDNTESDVIASSNATQAENAVKEDSSQEDDYQAKAIRAHVLHILQDAWKI